MMLRMYKFKCAPNNPVCDGIVIFAVRDYKEMDEMVGYAVDLAKTLGLYRADEDATLTYLGTFMPAVEHPEIPYVIDYQTGEY